MQAAPLATWAYALAAVLAVSLASLLGAFLLTLRPKTLHDNLHVLVSFAAGALFGDAFIHLLPEAFARAKDPLPVSLLVLLGLFLFLVLERLILWRTSTRACGWRRSGLASSARMRTWAAPRSSRR